MSANNSWKGLLKCFLLGAGANYKRNQQAGRSYDPLDEKWWPRDPTRNGLNDELIHAAKTNADPERGA